MLLTNKYVLIGGAVAALGAVLLLKKAGGVVADAAQAVNPFNNDNIINQGATSIYQDVTGSTGTIGGDLYDATHGGALDVTSENNVVYKNLTDFGGWLGGKMYDWTH